MSRSLRHRQGCIPAPVWRSHPRLRDHARARAAPGEPQGRVPARDRRAQPGAPQHGAPGLRARVAPAAAGVALLHVRRERPRGRALRDPARSGAVRARARGSRHRRVRDHARRRGAPHDHGRAGRSQARVSELPLLGRAAAGALGVAAPLAARQRRGDGLVLGGPAGADLGSAGVRDRPLAHRGHRRYHGHHAGERVPARSQGHAQERRALLPADALLPAAPALPPRARLVLRLPGALDRQEAGRGDRVRLLRADRRAGAHLRRAAGGAAHRPAADRSGQDGHPPRGDSRGRAGPHRGRDRAR